jgi:hypothetical protein
VDATAAVIEGGTWISGRRSAEEEVITAPDEPTELDMPAVTGKAEGAAPARQAESSLVQRVALRLCVVHHSVE